MIQQNQTMPETKADSTLDLLLKAQSGDDEALNRLLERCLPRLRRWAKGRLPAGLRTMLDTGDLVQEAVIHALPHLDKLEIRSESALQFYLQQAVKNRVIDLHRRARRRPARAEIPENIVAEGTSPEQAAIGAEALARYERGLASLKSEDRQAIVLRVELGLGYDEMASQLGKPSSAAARMATTRAIVRLADVMGRRSRSGSAD
jgi:RNA polymerase sigma-70 factor, ECF subfamily